MGHENETKPCIGDDDVADDGDEFARRTFQRFPAQLRGESFHLASVTRRKFSARDFISNGLVVSCLFALLVEKLGPISVPRSHPPLKSRYAG